MDFKKLGGQILRFLLGGGVGGILQYAIYFSFSYLNVWHIISNIIGFVVGTTVNFSIQKNWAFQNKDHWTKKQACFFAITKISILAVHSLILYVCVDINDLSKTTGQIIAIIPLAIVSFKLTKLIFKNPEK